MFPLRITPTQRIETTATIAITTRSSFAIAKPTPIAAQTPKKGSLNGWFGILSIAGFYGGSEADGSECTRLSSASSARLRS